VPRWQVLHIFENLNFNIPQFDSL